MARDPKSTPVREVAKEDLEGLCRGQEDLSMGIIELVFTDTVHLCHLSPSYLS